VSFVSWVHGAPDWLRDLLVAVLVLLTVPVGWASIALSPPDSSLATWWPAAGFAVVAATIARGNRIGVVLAILAVGMVANLAAGRPLPVAIGFGAGNALEAWVMSSIATRGGRQVSIDRIGDAERLFLAVVAGAVVTGVAFAAVVTFADRGDGLSAGAAAAASHGSAVLLLGPLAILPRVSFRTDRVRELAVQLVALLGVLALIFAPAQQLPVAFLVFPVIVWGSFRFGIGILALETLVTTVVVTGSMFWNGGPFAPIFQTDPDFAVHLVQLYVVVIATTTLILGRARADWLRSAAIGRAREVVLRSGITGSTVGFVILEREADGQLRLAAANDVADDLLHAAGDEWQAGETLQLEQFAPPLIAPLANLIAGNGETWQGRISEPDADRIVDASMTRVRSARGTVVLTVQVEDVTTREEARLANERALDNERATVEKLREANRQKDDFVSAVSHELRTPLTSIVGFADELTHLDLPPEAHSYLEIITRNAGRLNDLVEDLLEVGRLNSQTQLRAVEKLDVDAVIDGVLADLHHAAAARSLTVERVGKERTSVNSVRADVTRILVNLVSNAIKFSPEGGQIEIAVERSAVHLQIRVRDNGPGIAAADLDRVFERFYRASSAATVPGSGLGLVIARGLAEGLGGTVRLQSVEGAGTTALLTLPLTATKPRR